MTQGAPARGSYTSRGRQHLYGSAACIRREYAANRPSNRLIYLAILAEREGFEPPDPFESAVFKTAALNRSATSPGNQCLAPSRRLGEPVLVEDAARIGSG